jgi:hypothetical protein
MTLRKTSNTQAAHQQLKKTMANHPEKCGDCGGSGNLMALYRNKNGVSTLMGITFCTTDGSEALFKLNDPGSVTRR